MIPAKHAAIATGSRTIVHAYSGRAVAENDLPEAWARRIAFVFEYPTVFDRFHFYRSQPF
ncbi:hypothetical protein PQJ75_11400 [Rhodoplanes sp. TEM]|uniref:hypothetical protein n=1 Tax=Rhodoplanes TaxID=29407 RepID=UPI00234FB1F0|nr:MULTISPECIES: hypothetical protein [Rhodoplanes]MDC7984338.1 hypothetical protein [Rhodoplanes sp. TEM]MDQ0353168.1 hypothetical protein [Rhodoplanes tepidamans]